MQAKPILRRVMNSTLLIISAFVLLLGLNFASPACSAPINPSALPVVMNQEPLEILWKERHGQILVETVCFNYPDNSKERRGCLKLAIKKFRDECERFTRLYNDSRPYYLDEYRDGMEKYCQASSGLSSD